MTKVITYGTFDLLHFGHIKLLERAKMLGDYLIVGVTADDFDKKRGKINVQQSLMERVESVKETGLADEIIIEEYEGQKIDDIIRMEVDIFTIGSDWVGQFDYLDEFCTVVYLDRTKGISSSELRSEKREVRLGLVGESNVINKFANESQFVNGVNITALCTTDSSFLSTNLINADMVTDNYKSFLENIDAVYIISHPSKHYQQIKEAIQNNKNVLCESPIALNKADCDELFSLAHEKGCILMEGLKTAYSTAYSRLLLLVKSEIIGAITSVEATCTSLKLFQNSQTTSNTWNSICAWGPTAMLPVFQILGTDYIEHSIVSKISKKIENFDLFTKINFIYKSSVATINVGKGVKSEGNLVIAGTKGYIYVPSPWWKTDYFEVRFENQEDTKRYFYQLEGEGIRYEIVAFLKAIETGKNKNNIDQNITSAISSIIEDFYQGNYTKII
ncbi:Gfo/Idh/MocA family oxidoreductase [Amedibacillus sp. YH-ame10]